MNNINVEDAKQKSREKPVFDPSLFGDPLASKTEWTPLKGGGTNFRTHRLQQVDDHRLQLKATVGARIFHSVLLIVGLGIMSFFLWPFFREDGTGLEFKHFIPLFFGGIFAVIGGALMFFGNRLIVFDKKTGYFWKGRKTLAERHRSAASKKGVSLQDIHALQIIREYITSSKHSYYSYEMNLVLKEGRRVNVVDHGNIEQIRRDARTLSRFLGRPVWDATQQGG